MSRLSLACAAVAVAFACPAAERDPSITMGWFRVFAKTSTNNEGPSFLTDIVMTSNTVVEVELEIMDFAHDCAIFCARGSSAKDREYRLSHTSGNKWSFAYGSSSASGGSAEQGRRHALRAGPDGLYVDGKLAVAATSASFVSPGFLRLFGTHTYDESTDSYAASRWGCGNARFYSFKIYEPNADGTLKLAHDIRGCRTMAGTNAIYDDVTGSVFTDDADYHAKQYPVGGPYIVPSADGIGDVVALTNAIKCATALSSRTPERSVRLDAGLYDLSGVAMAAGSYINLSGSSIVLAGNGSDRADTILLGGGADGAKRVIYLGSGGQVVSNLTVTGGYVAAAGDGGGISSYAAGYGTVVDCIVSNNYARGSNGNGGGGIWGVGMVRGCLIADNRSAVGGGCRSCTRLEDCDFVNNRATSTYGGGDSGGYAKNCRFIGNVCSYHGGGKHAGVAVDCFFMGNVCHSGGNYGTGGGLHSATATNCTFVGNAENNSDGGYGSAAAGSKLIGCTITNSTGRISLFNACTLRDCYIADSGARRSNASYPFRVFGYYSNNGQICTNVNCVVENISLSNAADRVAVHAKLVNCTVRNVKCKTNGPLDKTCTAVNTIISGCTPYDLVAGTSSTQLVNCVYQTASGEFAEGQLVNCKQARSVRYDATNAVPCAVRASSPAYNAALEEDWILSLVGDVDFAGQPRVKFGALDIGAVECQSDYVPGLVLKVW